MHFLILLLLALAFFLYITFRLWRQSDKRKYLVIILLIDTWLVVVLGYLLSTAFIN